MRRSLLALVLAALLAPRLAASLLVVDAQGGAAFTSIQAAVTAAADGDVVLVKAGTYARFAIVHKGVAVVADSGAQVDVVGGILVKDTLVQHRVLLRGLDSTGEQAVAGSEAEGLRVDVARGPLRVEECSFRGGDGVDYTAQSPGAAGVRAEVALDLSFVRSVSRGGDGGLAFTGGLGSAGGHGMVAVRSKVALHACTLLGGTPANADELGEGAPGGSGIVFDDGTGTVLPSSLFAAGTTFAGANGSIDAWCVQGGDGGNGVVLDGAQSKGWFLDCVFQPGVKGACGSIWPGVDGVDVKLQNGAAFGLLPGLSREIDATSPVREQQALALDLSAAPSDQCFLLVTMEGTWQLELALSGVLLDGAPYFGGLIPLGAASPAGSLSLALPVPLLPAGVDHVVVHLQGVFADAGGGYWLGGPTTPLVLDSAF